MSRKGGGTDLQLGDLSEGGLEGGNELRFQLAVDLLAGVFIADIAAYVGVEQQGVGDLVGVNAAAADGNVNIQTDVAVDHAEGDGRGRAELVVDQLFRVEVVDALVLAGVAAVGKALADGLEGLLDGGSQLAGEDAGLCGGVVGELAGFGADLDDLSLLHDDHALTVSDSNAGAVGDDVVVALGIGGTGGDLLLALDHQHIFRQGFTVEEFLPLVGQCAAQGSDSSFDKSHGVAPFMYNKM